MQFSMDCSGVFERRIFLIGFGFSQGCNVEQGFVFVHNTVLGKGYTCASWIVFTFSRVSMGWRMP